MKHLNLTPEQFCDATGACKYGRKFALTQRTMADVWDHCQRPDWLLWILDAIDNPKDSKTLRLFAVWCACNTPMPDGRVTGVLLIDPRSIAALGVAERYANGQATDKELAAAWASAWTAAGAAAGPAAGDAARAAARASSWDAELVSAWDAAWVAARDTAWNAAWASSWDAEWAAARDAAGAAQADQLRKMVANPFAQGGAA